MIQWGINALNHGSGLAVFKDGIFQTDFISKDQDELPSEFIRTALNYGSPDRVFWYEDPWVKKARQIYARQWSTALDMSALPKRYLKRAGLGYAPVTYTAHHASHAAAGYYTSPFNHCAVIVLDAIGEFESATIWNCMHGEMKKVWSARYPNSLGLFYSAFTKLLGLTPIKDEHLLQRMAEQGNPDKYKTAVDNYFGSGTVDLRYNFHRGVLNWSPEPQNLQDQCDIAAAVQRRFELAVASVFYRAKQLTSADCVVYMGGCAMNSQANKFALSANKFKYVWSMPDPGDASSALGAVAYHTKQRIWRNWGPVKHIDIRV